MTALQQEKIAEQQRIRDILKESPDTDVIDYVCLYCTEGTSDKVYHLYLRRDSGGKKYRVEFSYGRRGGTLQDDTKTPAAVDFQTAKRLFDETATEKMTKKANPYVMETPKFPPKAVPKKKKK